MRAPADWRILAVYSSDDTFPEFVNQLHGPRITPVQCNLANPDQVSALFQEHGHEWDACVYLAAKVDIPWSVREPQQDLFLNAGSLLNVLDRVRVGRFIYFSSGAVYDGAKGEVPPHTPVAPTLPYAVCKRTCEDYVRFHGERRRSVGEYLIVRFFGAYGPYEAPHKIYTRLVRAFALEQRDTYVIYGDGQNLIDAMYVEDAVEAIQKMLTGSHRNDTVNLAGGRPLTIEALVREVGGALGIPSVKIEKRGVANERNEFWGSTGEMKDYFGFECRTSLADGIARFRDFIVSGKSRVDSVDSAAVLSRSDR